MTSLLVFGSQLLALSEDGGRLLIWDTHTGGEVVIRTLYTHISFGSTF